MMDFSFCKDLFFFLPASLSFYLHKIFPLAVMRRAAHSLLLSAFVLGHIGTFSITACLFVFLFLQIIPLLSGWFLL